MPTLSEIFDKRKILLYQNESLDLDHYYQEPYQDENDEIKDMGKPFETDESKKIRTLDLYNEDRTYSGFSYFMDGSRRTYKIGDMVLEGKKIFPVVVAQVRAGCTERDRQRKLRTHGSVQRKNLLLLSDKMNEVDFQEIRQRILKTQMANSGTLEPNHMLTVDGPLQFIRQDTGKPEFADMFYNVVGVSKSFDPMLPTSSKSKRGGTQIGAELLKLEYGQRTPVFLKENSKHRRYGCWYLRIRPKNRVAGPLEGIIKVEKMAVEEDLERDGLDSSVVDNISLWLLNEGSPTCYGRDER